MDASALTTNRIKHGEIEIEDVGTIRVRGMSRYELMHANRLRDEKGHLAAERYTIAACMVDPVMTEDQVAAWQRASEPGEINEVGLKINELSGLGKGADKSDLSSTGDGAES